MKIEKEEVGQYQGLLVVIIVFLVIFIIAYFGMRPTELRCENRSSCTIEDSSSETENKDSTTGKRHL